MDRRPVVREASEIVHHFTIGSRRLSIGIKTYEPNAGGRPGKTEPSFLHLEMPLRRRAYYRIHWNGRRLVEETANFGKEEMGHAKTDLAAFLEHLKESKGNPHSFHMDFLARKAYERLKRGVFHFDASEGKKHKTRFITPKYVVELEHDAESDAASIAVFSRKRKGVEILRMSSPPASARSGWKDVEITLSKDDAEGHLQAHGALQAVYDYLSIRHASDFTMKRRRMMTALQAAQYKLKNHVERGLKRAIEWESGE